MKVIVPMAGMGTRLRPTTLTTPKPLVKIAGKSIVHRLLENIFALVPEKITEIGFIIGNFPEDIILELKQISHSLGAEAQFFKQNVPLGTAHAIYMAKDLLSDKVIIAFADTIITAHKQLELNNEAIIFTKKVENPSQYGVVLLNEYGSIIKFIEKPQEPISNQAIVGIYYFQKAQLLLEQIEYLIKNDIRVKGEYQLTDALENMLRNGVNFKHFEIEQWLDTGNKKLLLETNKQLLNSHKNSIKSQDAILESTLIIEPVFLGHNVEIKNSIIGPYVSIEDNAKIENSIIKKSVIFENSYIKNSHLNNSLIGKNAKLDNFKGELHISDYSTINIS